MSAAIHPRAEVDSGARLAPDVTVGPFAVVEAGARLGRGVTLDAHAVVLGTASVGEGSRVGHHAVLGGDPQIRGSVGRAGELDIGCEVQIREFATVHAGSEGGKTCVGDGCLLMAYSHVAHDCTLGCGVELANNAQLAGHVQLDDHASVAGLAGVHQFVRIGQRAFVAAGSMVSRDVPPFCLAAGDRAAIFGINSEGLRRGGLAKGLRAELSVAVRWLLYAPSLSEGLARVERELGHLEEVSALVRFVRQSRRGICAPARKKKRDD